MPACSAHPRENGHLRPFGPVCFVLIPACAAGTRRLIAEDTCEGIQNRCHPGPSAAQSRDLELLVAQSVILGPGSLTRPG